MLAPRTDTWPSRWAYICLIFLRRSMPFSPRSVESANERRDIGWFLCALGRNVDRCRLLLGKTEGNVDTHPWLYRSLCSTQTFMRAWYFDVSIWDPGEHSWPCANICSALVLKLENTSIQWPPPASPTRGEIVWTIFLYSCVCCSRLSL